MCEGLDIRPAVWHFPIVAKRGAEDRLTKLVAQMRELGVMSLSLPDGTGIELGPVPAAPRSTEERTPKTPEQNAEEQRARRHNVLFAATSMRPRLNPVPSAKRQ